MARISPLSRALDRTKPVSALLSSMRTSTIGMSITRFAPARQPDRVSDKDRSSKPDTRLVAVVADAHRWVCDLAEGRAASVRDLARQNNRDAADVSRTLPLAFLAPAIVEAIMEGRQPVGLTPRALERIGMLPCSWDDQRRRLGFPL